jgi:hypothetical protein
LPPTATRAELVQLAMLRWRIERDYQELKTNWGSITSKAGAGAVSITTPRSASPRMPPSPRSGWRIPTLSPSPSSAPLVSPQASRRGVLRMRYSFVLLNRRTAVSVPDNLALALRRLNQGSPQIDVVQVRAVPIVTDLSKHLISDVRGRHGGRCAI